MDVLADPFPSNGRPYWFRNSCLEQICRSINYLNIDLYLTDFYFYFSVAIVYKYSNVHPYVSKVPVEKYQLR
jgi:hypothetical protein